MPSPGSVTRWLGQLKEGDTAAAQVLFARSIRRLAGLARKKLRPRTARVTDGEDVALSALHTFWTQARKGVFPKLEDRDDLWQVLVLLTARKAIGHNKREGALKRGGTEEPVSADLDAVIGAEPSPAFAAQVAEEVRLLMGCLDGDLRQVAIWKMEGYSNEEIADRLQCVPRTVERKLRVIRSVWSPEVAPC